MMRAFVAWSLLCFAACALPDGYPVHIVVVGDQGYADVTEGDDPAWTSDIGCPSDCTGRFMADDRTPDFEINTQTEVHDGQLSSFSCVVTDADGQEEELGGADAARLPTDVASQVSKRPIEKATCTFNLELVVYDDTGGCEG